MQLKWNMEYDLEMGHSLTIPSYKLTTVFRFACILCGFLTTFRYIYVRFPIYKYILRKVLRTLINV